jgi:two-component system cell cycle sensor histidine kinase/response regulator CckA
MTSVRAPGDGTSREYYEDALLRLSRISRTDGRTAEDVLHEACSLISATLDVARVGVWLFADEKRAIRCESLYQQGRLDVTEGTLLRAIDFPIYFDAIRKSRMVCVIQEDDDTLAQEFREAYLKPLGVTSMIDVPIYRGGDVAGIVCHEHIGPPRRWTEDECQFAASVGDIAGRLCEESSRRRAEEQLDGYERRMVELQRMSAMGRMAAGIAHDFNNVLTGILGYADLIREYPLSPEVSGHVKSLGDVADVGRRLTKELQAYALGDGHSPRVTALDDVIKRSRGMLDMAIGNELSLRLQLASQVGRVFVDPTQVERVLLNLAINARDASPAPGTVTVSLKEALPPRASEGSRNRYVMLEVRDEGHGMTPEVRDRVLEPFFTTKGSRGTGLGLAIVDQVATSAGGFVDIESEPGQGTAVRVFLPRIADAV